MEVVGLAAYSIPSGTHKATTGVPIVVDTKALTKLARDLSKAAPEAYLALHASLRAIGDVVAADARARSSFSTRIPGSIKVRVGKANVKIIAGGVQAPDAAPLENRGVAGTFRHPVYGNREVWVDQPAHPFLAPALEAHRQIVAAAVSQAVVSAVSRAIETRL